jgi:hypothetical protein
LIPSAYFPAFSGSLMPQITAGTPSPELELDHFADFILREFQPHRFRDISLG